MFVGDYVHVDYKKECIPVCYIAEVAKQSDADRQKNSKFTTII